MSCCCAQLFSHSVVGFMLTSSLKYRENRWFRLVQHSKWFKMIQSSIPIGSNQHQSALPCGFRFTLTLRLRLVVPMPQVTSQRSQRPQSSLYRRKQHLFRFEHKFQWIPTNTDNIKFQRMLSNFWTICRTLGSSQLHETQHVIVLHAIQPQAPLWNQHWKKESARVQQTSEDHL